MSDIDYGHWDVSLVGKFEPIEHFGFVYQITNLIDGKSYIGCKHLMKYKKGKPIKASEWRSYCSSSKHLQPQIEELGKENFSFTIILLCDNKRNLYYNEMKIQIQLGVLETDDYYNANVGGKRFYRPVKSYTDPDFIKKISGMNSYKFKGNFIVTYKDNVVNLIKNTGLREFAKENGYDHRRLSELGLKKRKTHKDIKKLEFVNDQKEN
jgi:hypothetical protein